MAWISLLCAVLLSSLSSNMVVGNCPGKHDDCYNIGELKVDIEVNKDEISLRWQVNSTEWIYGFKVLIKDSDDAYIYESPVLNKNAIAMIITETMDTQKVQICVTALLNETEVIAEVCEEFQNSNLQQMIVGILAGVVFLIPCVAALSYIIYKDRQIGKLEPFDPTEIKVLIGVDKPMKKVKNAQKTPEFSQLKGKENIGFDNEMAPVKQQTKASLEVETDLPVTLATTNDSKVIEGAALGDSVNEHSGDNPLHINVPKTAEMAVNDEEEETQSNDAKIFVIRL